MAGDWIPMRTNLKDDPTVVFIARATKLQADHVVGKLHHLWSWVDAHAADGDLQGIDAAWIDRYVGKRGFAAAMAAAPAPWLEISEDGVSIPNFATWFGSSAKTRVANSRLQSVKRASGGSPRRACITAAVKRQVQARDGVHCRYCGYDTSKTPPPYGKRFFCNHPHFDHVIPVCQGGSNTAENVVIACSDCNLRKNGRTPEEVGLSLLPVPNVTQSSDQKVTREEKSREETTTPTTDSNLSNAQHPVGGEGDDFQAAWDRSKPMAQRIRKILNPDLSRPLSPTDRRWVMQVAILADRYGSEWIDPAFEAAANTKNIANPKGLLGSVLNDQCLRMNTNLNRELASVRIPESEPA
jgi:5-methylcytosine-specific restriction endonuclease McrA